VNWDFDISKSAEKQMLRLDHGAQKEIFRYVRTRIMGGDPYRFGKPMRGKWLGFWRWRVGDYRIVGKIINDQFVVLIVEVGHRSTVYKEN
jgi:mRNA interferase RelE/StbE